ncbi:MAG: hypothetical protein O7F14_12495 [Alphaproteobacteria bacterium]|nr:hypothetical protein [Alphaproteobacteria bacterium]
MATQKKASTYRIPENADVTKLIENAQKAFYEDSNVIGTRIGARRKGGEICHDEIVLIVLVKDKLPKQDVNKNYLIPQKFQGMETDVFAPFGPDAPKDALGFFEGHPHSDDMSFVAWERLHEQWMAESGGEIAWHGNVQDFGDVCVIEDDGTLVKTVGGIQTVDFVGAYKLFRTTHPDIYDFVTFFTDSAHGMPPQGGSSWYRFIFNDTQGIGFSPSWNLRPTYGSNVLQGIMFLNQGHFPTWRYVMLQEQAHRWAAFSRYRDTASGPNQNDHMLGGWGHWSYPFDEDRSPMSYDPYNWQATNGDFRRVTLTSEERSYCNLDLYLMGLLGPLEVGDFSLLSDISLISGNLYSATKKRLTTKNIIWAEGARVPSVSTSQKLFKNGFVVITGDMEKVHDLVDRVDFLRLRFEDDFYDATKNLAKVDTSLGPLRGTTATEFRTVSINIPPGTGRRSIEGNATFSATVRRASVALNGFKLDYVSSDHHINIAEADTDIVSISGNTVTFRVQCNYADKNFDDPYQGYVTALVIAEVG